MGKAVPESARKLCQVEQIPFFDTATEDFAVAVLRGGKGLPVEDWDLLRAKAIETIRRLTQASGSRSVAAGGDIISSTITPGNENVIQQGSYNANIKKARDVSMVNNVPAKDADRDTR